MSMHATTSITALTLFLALAVLVVPLAAQPQEAGKVARIGMLASSPSGPLTPSVEKWRETNNH